MASSLPEYHRLEKDPPPVLVTLTLTGRGPSHVTGEYPHAFASVSVRDFFVGLRPSCPTVCLGGHWWVAVVAGAELRLSLLSRITLRHP